MQGIRSYISSYLQSFSLFFMNFGKSMPLVKWQFALCLAGVFLMTESPAQHIVAFESIFPEQKAILQKSYTVFRKSKVKETDSMLVQAELRRSLEWLFAKGYLEARFDSLSCKDGDCRAWWFTGVRYEWAELRMTGKDEFVFVSAGIRDKFYRNKPLSPGAYAIMAKKVLDWCSNNGYPFALVRLDSVKTEWAGLKARFTVDKGDPVVMDTALIKGTVKISEAYLYNYLGIKPGAPFNGALLSKVSVRLREIPFVTEARPFELEFTPGKARPVLFLQSRKASQFNGVVGVQPDNVNPGKVFVTGDVRLRLLNAFGKAELLDLNWSNPLPRSQDLKVKFSYPFLFSLPVGVEGELMLFKKDSTFLELNRQIGFRYFFAGNNSFRVFFGRKTSNLISTKGYENITSLPPFADVGANTFGLGVLFQRLDYRLNPRQGFSVDVNAGAGVRVIDKNARINPEAYDSLSLRATQYKAEGIVDFYIPLFSRAVVNIGAMGGWMQNENIFSNELYRFGGLRSLRGFDEASLLASSYVVGKIEYRFILEQNSYLLLFYNRAWYEDRSREEILTDTPYGFGAGITFDTKLGIFSFTYALGSQQSNPIEFRAAKVHFGLVNYF
ncbi:MAG: BamA/TamA family outer membrane protein [Bacteroidetes bacterium]|nr:BamA/TamA family outer membrane protein [Bacteroidota bacterium]